MQFFYCKSGLTRHFLKYENIGFFFGLWIFYLIFPGYLFFDIFGIYDNPLGAFIILSLPISLELTSITYVIKKKFPYRSIFD